MARLPMASGEEGEKRKVHAAVAAVEDRVQYTLLL
jgi:hypothetical protein